MNTPLWGAILGAALAAGVLMTTARIMVIRRPQLALRVLPYVRDLPQVGRTPSLRVTSSSPTVAAAGIFGPFLRSAADLVEKILGGATSVRRRLERAAIHKTVHEFRIEQVLWGLACFGLVAAYSLIDALSGSTNPVTSLLLCALGFVFGVLARDNRLSSQATNRERLIISEFPTVAELLALAVAAGESPVAALDRVVRRSGASSPQISPGCWPRSAPAPRSRLPSTSSRQRPDSHSSPASRPASRSPSSVAPRWPMCSTRRPLTCGRPGAAT